MDKAPPNRPSQTTATTVLYTPSIYGYTCRGKFAASSKSFAPYNNTSTSPGSDVGVGGVCRGFQSQIEVLHEQDNRLQLSRAEALRRFNNMVADSDLYDDSAEGGGLNHRHHNNNNNQATNVDDFRQQTQSVLLSPSLIFQYDNDENDDQHSAAPSEGALVYPTDSDMQNTDHNIPTNISTNNNDRLLEEELIVRQEWTCYGSTEVDCLILTNAATGEEHVAAVAPHTTGLSVREIETSDSLRKLTRFGLGFLDIVYDSNSELVAEDEEDISNGVVDQKTLGKEPRNPVRQSPEEVPPRPSTEALVVAQQCATRTMEFSKQVLNHMQWNAQWFVANVTDDFPARTVAAGRTIVQHLPITAERTLEAMKEIVDRMVGGNDDDDK